jgi:hypothetical protein
MMKGPHDSSFTDCGLMNKTVLVIVILLASQFAILDSANAQQAGGERHLERQPVYGQYWQSERWGWYGAKRVVRTPADAQQILEQFFIHHQRDVRVVRISEKAHFFVAEVINGKGVMVDLILIDKRTGRMRSMY